MTRKQPIIPPLEETVQVVLLSSCDCWEALYINGTAVTQEHQIDRHSFLKYAEKYDFKEDYIIYLEAEPEDEDEAERCGKFPDKLEELVGDYEELKPPKV